MSSSRKALALLIASIIIIGPALTLTSCVYKNGEKLLATDKETAQANGEGESLHNGLPYVTLTYYFPHNIQPGQDEVYDEFNKKLKERINATIDFKGTVWADYANKIQMLDASGEEYDLCFTSNWMNSYIQNASKGAYLPLDDLLVEYAPKTFAQVPMQYWDISRVRGKIYGVINYQIMVRCAAVASEEEKLKRHKFDLKAETKPNDLRSLEPYIEKAINDVPGSYTHVLLSDMSEYCRLDTLVGSNTPGAIDVDAGNTKVINQFKDSKRYRDLVKLLQDWNKKGWQAADVRITRKVDDPIDDRARKFVIGVGGAYTPYLEGISSLGYGFHSLVVPSGKPIATTGGVISSLTAISRNSKNPERAMMYLEEINTDTDLYMTLNYGIKGKHWDVEDGFMVQGPEQQQYNPNVSWMHACMFTGIPAKGLPKNIWDQVKEMNETADRSPLLGFTFNSEPVKAEVGKCQAVYDEYYRAIEIGAITDEQYQEFLDKLDAAGAEKIIEEMQRQVDEWLASREKNSEEQYN
ncbi:MAG TPA: ABC transporter substrate-binding protein [Clostridiaceae bacterium]|nr:ABC transporter substrate-binding protein [Clostridiaceae bacterium]